jgi:two-component system, NarL family, nitrate/nitrite response regulator NarL
MTAGTATRVFVSEDHPVYREGLVESIRGRPQLELVGEAADGAQAFDRIRELRPDVALLDLRLPVMDGIGVLKALRESDVETRVLLLSAYSEGALIYEAMQGGAAGYLSKDAPAAEICAAIEAAASGETVLSPGLDRKLATQISHQADRNSRPSGREMEVLTLMADGLSSATIGERLHLSEGTVKTYVRRLYEKLGVCSRPAAIAEAMRRGILS